MSGKFYVETSVSKYPAEIITSSPEEAVAVALKMYGSKLQVVYSEQLPGEFIVHWKSIAS